MCQNPFFHNLSKLRNARIQIFMMPWTAPNFIALQCTLKHCISLSLTALNCTGLEVVFPSHHCKLLNFAAWQYFSSLHCTAVPALIWLVSHRCLKRWWTFQDMDITVGCFMFHVLCFFLHVWSQRFFPEFSYFVSKRFIFKVQ